MQEKISDLIKKLENIKDTHGDLEVAHADHDEYYAGDCLAIMEMHPIPGDYDEISPTCSQCTEAEKMTSRKFLVL